MKNILRKYGIIITLAASLLVALIWWAAGTWHDAAGYDLDKFTAPDWLAVGAAVGWFLLFFVVLRFRWGAEKRRNS